MPVLLISLLTVRNMRRGLTLIEVIVAMLLFCVGGLALAAASGAIAKQMRLTKERSHAAGEARSTIEKAKASE